MSPPSFFPELRSAAEKLAKHQPRKELPARPLVLVVSKNSTLQLQLLTPTLVNVAIVEMLPIPIPIPNWKLATLELDIFTLATFTTLQLKHANTQREFSAEYSHFGKLKQLPPSLRIDFPGVLILAGQYCIIFTKLEKPSTRKRREKTMQNITDTIQGGGGGGKHIVFSSPR